VPLPLVQNTQWPASAPSASIAVRATGASAPVYQAGAKLGASTRAPLPIDSSIEVSGPVETTPYESSATSAVAANVTGQ
jgi:hypothetical protein